MRELVVTDFAQGMVDVARAKHEQGESSLDAATCKCTFQVMDVQKLDAEDASYDCVVDSFGICSFECPHAAQREMHRVLRPGGTLLLLEHGRSNAGFGLGSLLNRWLDRRALPHVHRWGCFWNRDIEAIVGSAGFEVERVESHSFGTTYEIVARKKKEAADPA